MTVSTLPMVIVVAVVIVVAETFATVGVEVVAVVAMTEIGEGMVEERAEGMAEGTVPEKVLNLNVVVPSGVAPRKNAREISLEKVVSVPLE